MKFTLNQSFQSNIVGIHNNFYGFQTLSAAAVVAKSVPTTTNASTMTSAVLTESTPSCNTSSSQSAPSPPPVAGV